MKLMFTHRRIVGQGLVTFGLIVSLLSTLRAEDAPHFKDVVERHFDRWAKSSAGTLTSERIVELVRHTEIRGPEAAAIAAIHCYQRKAGHAGQQMTLQQLTQTRKEDATLRRDQAASGANLSHNFNSFLKHINSTPRKVFTNERPSLEGISQGHLGDCYFVAGVGAAAHRNPDQIRQLLTPHEDGTCDVRFPNGHNMRIPSLTDAELALGSNAGNQGLWLNILETAAGIVEQRERNKTHDLALDTVGGGGDSIFTIQLLTGHKALKDSIRAHVHGQRPAPNEHDIPRLANQIARSIQEGIEHRRLVCCGVGEWHVPPGMGKYHQYAILGLKQSHVEIWNPWGKTYHFKPNGPPGLQHGYPTEGGRFSMPIQDFVHVFGAVNVETNQPLR